MNPFSHLDESEKAQAERYSELLVAENYWHNKSNEAFRLGKYHLANVCGFRARFYYQLRVEHVIY